jgi:hypothetical protein
MDKTYVELLAENDRDARETFDENAKDQLVDQNDYEDTVQAEDHHPDEIDDQDAFKKFGGSHQLAAGPAPSKEAKESNKQSILYDKDVKIHVLNIDSRFRL